MLSLIIFIFMIFLDVESQLYYCDGIQSNDTLNVCSGRGMCILDDLCDCNDKFKWTGPICNTEVTWTCSGVSKTSSEVCSGHGTCVKQDDCQCYNETYSQPICEEEEKGGLPLREIMLFIVLPSSVGLLILFFCIGVVLCCLCKLKKKGGAAKKKVDLMKEFDFREDHQPYFHQMAEMEEKTVVPKISLDIKKEKLKLKGEVTEVDKKGEDGKVETTKEYKPKKRVSL